VQERDKIAKRDIQLQMHKGQDTGMVRLSLGRDGLNWKNIFVILRVAKRKQLNWVWMYVADISNPLKSLGKKR
jgi:hypothetical protein